MVTSTAFAPGHISGFFAPVFTPNNILQSGSIGAGLSISLGATSVVEIIQAPQKQFSIIINNKSSPAPVTTLALHHLIGQNTLKIDVKTKLDVPIGQGFGMSGAGALSATLAAAKILQLPSSDALIAAHTAEVELRTGLGDVIASNFGGIEIRKSAGLPPWGLIEHIPGTYELVVCIVGKKIKTKQVLSDLNKMNTINSVGRLCTKQLLEHPSVERFFTLSYDFAVKTGLATEKIQQLMKQIQTIGHASMCMLGNSIFAIGKIPQLCQILAPHGKLFVCNVDTQGARILQ
jgi:pantoate kinase